MVYIPNHWKLCASQPVSFLLDPYTSSFTHVTVSVINVVISQIHTFHATDFNDGAYTLAMSPGLYIYSVFSSSELLYTSSFLVSSSDFTGSDILFVSPQATFAAYNNYLSNSNYYVYGNWLHKFTRRNFDIICSKLSLNVPLSIAREIKLNRLNLRLHNDLVCTDPCESSHLGQAELSALLCLQEFSASSALKIGYISDCFSTSPRFTKLSLPKLVVIAGHSEYWSRPYRHWLHYLKDLGINLLFLSGNTGFRGITIVGNSLYVYAQGLPPHSPYSSSLLTGCYYNSNGYMTFSNGVNISSLSPFNLRHNHFGYESHFESFKPFGHETDKPLPRFLKKIIVHAASTGKTPCYFTQLDHASGSSVFSANSVSFSHSLSLSPSTKSFLIDLLPFMLS